VHGIHHQQSPQAWVSHARVRCHSTGRAHCDEAPTANTLVRGVILAATISSKISCPDGSKAFWDGHAVGLVRSKPVAAIRLVVELRVRISSLSSR